MKNIRIYINQDNLHKNQQIMIVTKQLHYLRNVMRIQNEDQIKIFNGSNGEWLTQIIEVNKKFIKLLLIEQLREQKNEQKLILCFAIIKNTSLQFLIEKATELGVTELQPIISEYSIVKKINLQRCLANAIEASEQSNRLIIPQIHPPQLLSNLLPSIDNNNNIIYCGDPYQQNDFINSYQNKLNTYLLIGPEGGFSKKELLWLKQLKNLHFTKLHDNILRAETACLSAIIHYQVIKNIKSS